MPKSVKILQICMRVLVSVNIPFAECFRVSSSTLLIYIDTTDPPAINSLPFGCLLFRSQENFSSAVDCCISVNGLFSFL